MIPAPTQMLPPGGRRRSWVHYGVMMPGLPDPHRAFGVMAILGTPGVRLFANDDLIRTTPSDTAYLVSATSTMTTDQFRAYSMTDDCEIAADGSHLRLGADLVLDGRFSRFTVHRTHPEVQVELVITATDVGTQFVRLPGVYDHWSLLARARGRINGTDIDGLCTLEYARGVGLHSLLDRRLPVRLPASFFTYHVLNVDDETQLLCSYVLGPARIPVQRAVHVRTPDGAQTHRQGFEFVVHAYAPEALVTPDGRSMRMPQGFRWGAAGVVHVEGVASGDWVYGLGAGYVGTYDYEGTFRSRPISGRAYVEYIDCRSGAAVP